jgi:hypothetical protein
MCDRESALLQELSEKLIELEKLHNQKFDDMEQVLTYLMQKDKQQTQQVQEDL